MQKFKDKTSQEWTIDLHVALARRVREKTGVDLNLLLRDGMKAWAALCDDIGKLSEVLYWVCRAKCEERKLTDEGFWELLAGDAIGDAGEALGKALIDFFPDRAGRPLLDKMATKGQELKTLALTEAMTELEKLSPEKLLQTLKSSLTNGAASSESTPPP